MYYYNTENPHTRDTYKNKIQEVYNSYPDTCLPLKFKGPTGVKVKKCLFEELATKLYEDEARMVAHRVSRERIRLWIAALSLYYYEFLGESPV